MASPWVLQSGRSSSSRMKQLLPHIPHPSTRLGDPTKLNLSGVPASANSGTQRRQLERPHAAGLSRSRLEPIQETRNPTSDGQNGTAQLTRPGQSRNRGTRRVNEQDIDELEEALSEHLRTGGFYSMKASFKAFDPQGGTKITREALMRIVLNLYPTSSPETFKALMNRVKLDKQRLVAFDDFYSAFRPDRETWNEWIDPVNRKGTRTLTGAQVHFILKDKAKQHVLTLKSFFPEGVTPTSSLVKSDFRIILADLDLNLEKSEFEKLWNRYDTDRQGLVKVRSFLSALGLNAAAVAKTFDDDERAVTRAARRKEMMAGIGYRRGSSRFPVGVPGARGHSGLGQPSASVRDAKGGDIELLLTRLFNQGYMRMLEALKEKDFDGSGFIPKEDFRHCLSKFGIRLPPQDLSSLMLRCGFDEHGIMVPYVKFLEKFSDRDDGGLASSILADSTHRFHTCAPFEAGNKMQASDKGQSTTGCLNTPPEPIASVVSAEARLMQLLQGEFLSVLAAFQACDPTRTGTVTLDQCRRVLQLKLEIFISPSKMEAALQNMGGLTVGENVCYSKVLQHLDGACRTQRKRTHSIHGASDTFRPRPLTGDDRVAEITHQIQTCFYNQLPMITEAFQEMDFENTGRMTQSVLQGLLMRMGVKLSTSDLQLVWSKFIKKANNTLDFQEFLRHFCPEARKSKGEPMKHRADDRYYKRSQKLHRDEDMVVDQLKSLLAVSYYKVLGMFIECDKDNSDHVTVSEFEDIIKIVSHVMEDDEIATLARRFSDIYGRVNYQKFLAPFEPSQKTYRVGNDMSSLLAHKHDIIAPKKPPTPIPANPTRGLPGVIASLRQKIGNRWKPLMRALKRYDRAMTGYVELSKFVTVLANSGIHLHDSELFHITQQFDPKLQRQINYRDLISMVME